MKCKIIISFGLSLLALQGTSQITGTATVCVGSAVLLSDNQSGSKWSTDNTSVGTIDSSSGLFTGVGAGTTLVSYGTDTQRVTVLQTPAAITGNAGVCAGGGGRTTTLSNATGGGVWESGITSVADIDINGVVTGNNDGNTMISYTLPNGCRATTNMVVHPVTQLILANSGPGYAACLGGTGSLKELTPGGFWTSSNPAIATVSGDTIGKFRGVSIGSATITYTVAYGSAQCYQSHMVTVNPLPLAITGTLAICPGLTTMLHNPTSDANGTSWTCDDTTKVAILANGFLTSMSAGTTTVSYTVFSTQCSSTSIFTVNPIPSISGPQSVCVGLSTTLLGVPSGGTWMSSNPAYATAGPSPGIVTGVAADIPGNSLAAITYTTGAGCQQTIMVTVNPVPPDVAGSADVCIGGTTALSDGVSGAWSSSAGSAGIATIGTSGIVTGIAAGTATMSYTTPAGCYKTEVVTVHPAVEVITGSNAVCTGLTTALSDATQGGTWSSSATSVATISSAGVVTAVAPGTATISYTASSNCGSASVTKIITVNPTPAAISGSFSICLNATKTLTDATGGGTWSANAGSAGIVTVGAGGAVTGVGGGTATITYTLSAGCTATASVTVSPYVITGNRGLCGGGGGGSTTLSDAWAGGVWSSGNTSVATVGSSSGIVSGIVSPATVPIIYTLANGCTATAVLTLNPVTQNILSNPSYSACLGATGGLKETTNGGAWSSSNTAVATITGGTLGTFTGISAGTAIITYSVGYAGGVGCYQTRMITINPPPANITGATEVCAGSGTTLHDVTGAPSVDWTSSNTGVATILANGVLTSVAAGTTTITYILNSTNCYTTTVFTVDPIPAISGTQSVCAGSSVTLTGTPVGGTWASSNANVSIAPVTNAINGVTAGTSVVTYTSTAGCAKTAVVTVNALPASIKGTLTACLGGTTTLSDGGGGMWSSSATGVATIGTSGIVNGLSNGTATITYTLGTGCNATTVVTVNPFVSGIAGVAAACAGSATALTDATSGGTWSSSNTQVATIASNGVVTGISGGTTVISYLVNTTCGVAATATVATINALPAVSSISGTATLQVGNSVTLTDGTPGGTWRNDNANVASVGDASGIVIGLAQGSTNISYSVTDVNGCTAAAILSMTISLPSGSRTRQDTANAGGAGGVGSIAGASALHTTADNGATVVAGKQESDGDVISIGLQPNPNKGVFSIVGNIGTSTAAPIAIAIRDMQGQVVYSNQLSGVDGKINEQVQIGNEFAGGLYLLEIRTGVSTKIISFVIGR